MVAGVTAASRPVPALLVMKVEEETVKRHRLALLQLDPASDHYFTAMRKY